MALTLVTVVSKRSWVWLTDSLTHSFAVTMTTWTNAWGNGVFCPKNFFRVSLLYVYILWKWQSYTAFSVNTMSSEKGWIERINESIKHYDTLTISGRYSSRSFVHSMNKSLTIDCFPIRMVVCPTSRSIASSAAYTGQEASQETPVSCTPKLEQGLSRNAGRVTSANGRDWCAFRSNFALAITIWMLKIRKALHNSQITISCVRKGRPKS